ncbi:kelch-like protein 5 [Octopus bimaculoides]|uniref:kelch-like protein 5 n=1 Tax=Octopus bimaculoides TaxID=37653 RepID=UPI0022E03B33|nr:kelch-like protein 5 [Octopus bimaculoides]
MDVVVDNTAESCNEVKPSVFNCAWKSTQPDYIRDITSFPQSESLYEIRNDTVTFAKDAGCEEVIEDDVIELLSVPESRFDLKEETVEDLLSTACLLQLSEVVEACCNFLMKQLHPSNCIGIRQFADAQGCIDLYKAANNYVMENFVEVMENQEFLKLAPDDVGKLLSSEDLNVPSEETIFQALKAWAKHDLTNRKRHLSKLLSHIKLPLMAPQFIADHVRTDPIFWDDKECQDLIMEALMYHVLPERRSSFQSQRTKPRKSTVGVLYAVGAMDNAKGATTIERYDLRTNTWTQVANMNGRRLQFGVAVLDGRLYVVGGRDGLKTLNTVECYDPKRKTWSSMPPMSTHRHGLGVGVLEGPMYAVGGHDGWSYLNTVERWDPQARQWSYVAPMSTPRSTVGVAVLGGNQFSNKYITYTYIYTQQCNTVLCFFLYPLNRYDPKTDQWTMIAAMSTPRDAVGVCLLGDRLYAVGGYDGQQYLHDVECYDPVTNEWSKAAPLCTGRAGACVVHVSSTS